MTTTPEQVAQMSPYGTLQQWRETYEACERAGILDYWERAVTEIRPKLGLGPVEVLRWAEGMWSVSQPRMTSEELEAALKDAEEYGGLVRKWWLP